MCPDEPIGGCSQDIQVKRLRYVPGSPDFHGMKNRGVPDAIAIDLSDSRVLGVKIRGCGLASNQANLGGQMSVHGGDPRRRFHSPARHINVRYLSESMNSGIRSASAVQFNRHGYDLRESAL